MKTHADAFFAQGKAHMVCQDYAMAGTSEEGEAYAVVCDGCSSSPDTDVGARLLAHAASHHLKWCKNPLASIEQLILHAAVRGAEAVGARQRCLDATLLVARYRESWLGMSGVSVSLRGDGVFLARRRDGDVRVFVVEHEHNAPFYLSYSLNPERLEGYSEHYGQRSSVRSFSLGSGEQEVKEHEGHPEDFFFASDDHDLVVLFSDGVQTFQRALVTGTSKTFDPVSLEEVLSHLLRLKTPTGSFLQRRCHRFLTKHCALNDWQHADDFSAAAIWMENTDAP